MVDSDARSPFFTIGVTAYRRPELLRQTLTSILDQNFGDFEIIVGNDYPGDVLTAETVGITDPRIRYINNPVNLQEVGNMNALLAAAKGRYFTWLADDDAYEPDFLRVCHQLIQDNDLPATVFCPYRMFHGTDMPAMENPTQGRASTFNGREFLSSYFNGDLKIIGVYGVFDTAKLRQVVGGVEELCVSGVGLYGEYIFLVRCALFEKIIYNDSPLILYRGHATGWTATNIELDKYLCAGQELIRRCAEVLRHPNLARDLDKNLLAICKLHLSTYAGKTAAIEIAAGDFGMGAAARAMSRLKNELEITRSSFASERGTLEASHRAFFVRVLIKGCYTILGMLAINRFRKPGR